ncbi:MAG: acetylglutamate kinase [Eubacteriales bacterium]|nr:acetylglutamate kinase [Eubacteriales bacterium]
MFISNYDKAQVLTQALPYIQKYRGKTVVVKYGGNAMLSDGLRDAVISDIVLLSCVGINVVLVHGGGPEITEMMTRVGKESRFVNGLRYTDEESIGIVQMVLAGKTNKDLVRRIQHIGGKAVGLSGLDGAMIKAKRLDDGKNDYGYVGEIVSIDPSVISANIDRGYIPVVSTIAYGTDEYGDDKTPVYNINADIAASKIAVALGAQNLILLTDIRGIMRDVRDEDTLLPVVRVSEVDGLLRDGVISGGMIPKVNCCVDAVRRGISRTVIIDGRIEHSILLEILSDEGIGTMFIK